jgi:PadR family transcriptional regulator AphA
MSSTRLSESSYIVLGLLKQTGPATPYELKALAQISTMRFWAVPHTQLYSECARLAAAGLLSEQREQTGRRRRIYRLTDDGDQALDEWRSGPTEETYELRDTATLKLFFGGDPATLGPAQIEAHKGYLKAYEELLASIQDGPRGWRLALEGGIGHEREFIRFWTEVSEASAD